MPSRHVVREVVFGMLFFLLLPILASAASCEDADVIVRGAHIVTVDSAHPSISAMAIRDGRIMAVGSDQELAEYVSKRTEVMVVLRRDLRQRKGKASVLQFVCLRAVSGETPARQKAVRTHLLGRHPVRPNAADFVRA